MKYSEFRRWLAKQGAKFEAAKGSHFKVTLNGKSGDWRNSLKYPIDLQLDTNGQYLVTFPDIPEASYLAAAAFASAGTCSLALRWRFLKKRFTSRVRHRPSAFGSLIRKRRNSSGKQSAPK